MRLGIDIDGVLADFNSSFIDTVIRTSGKDLFPPRPFDIPTWYYPPVYGYTDEEFKASLDAVKSDPSFWLDLPAYETTRTDLSVLTQFADGDAEVYFITDRSGRAPKWQTELWLEWAGFNRNAPTVLISAEKGLVAAALKLDFYIDDRDRNVLDVRAASPKTRTFVFDRPWNRDLPVEIPRVSSVFQGLVQAHVDGK